MYLCAADGEGNAVGVTYTLNGSFGSAVVAPGTGFLLNNEMDDFAVNPGAANLYGLVQGGAPRRRRFSRRRSCRFGPRRLGERERIAL